MALWQLKTITESSLFCGVAYKFIYSCANKYFHLFQVPSHFQCIADTKEITSSQTCCINIKDKSDNDVSWHRNSERVYTWLRTHRSSRYVWSMWKRCLGTKPAGRSAQVHQLLNCSRSTHLALVVSQLNNLEVADKVQRLQFKLKHLNYYCLKIKTAYLIL